MLLFTVYNLNRPKITRKLNNNVFSPAHKRTFIMKLLSQIKCVRSPQAHIHKSVDLS